MPYWNHENITYQPQGTYFTVVLQLGDMFGGGGVPIDHYIIQVDNNTELETTGPTYSFNISYQTTLLVNISAHNCAGYSDPVTLELHYNHTSKQGIVFPCYFHHHHSIFNCTDGMGCDTPTSSVVTVAVSVAVGTAISTIIVILGLVALCKLLQWYTKSGNWK